jgi:hypothetical protein
VPPGGHVAPEISPEKPMAIRGVETTEEFFRPQFNIETKSQSNIDVI